VRAAAAAAMAAISIVAVTAGMATAAPRAPGAPSTASSLMAARMAERSSATPPVLVSRCLGQNAEVEDAVSARLVYVEWIGCNGIGFARSTDGGRHFGPAVALPGSLPARCTVHGCAAYSWDPAIAISPGGVVYAAFMRQSGTGAAFPVVDVSINHGASFAPHQLPVAHSSDPKGNWGDRDFIAVAPNGTVYVTWDYGPSASTIKFVCSPIGSCSFTGGDLNAVIQTSGNQGKTWGPVHMISPNFPYGGADIAEPVVQPNGTIDVLFQAFPTDPVTHALSPGNEYFTRSSDAGVTWTAPRKIGGAVGTVSLTEWWIDGAIATDSSGVLYATWDTQSASHDVGWLSTSTNGGTTWSTPINVTPLGGTAEQLVEAAGVGKGLADVAWQTPTPKGYATFVRPFSAKSGWLTKGALRVSTAYGSAKVWPGDTFGIEALPIGTSTSHGRPIVLSWGSANNGRTSEIYSSVVTP